MNPIKKASLSLISTTKNGKLYSVGADNLAMKVLHVWGKLLLSLEKKLFLQSLTLHSFCAFIEILCRIDTESNIALERHKSNKKAILFAFSGKNVCFQFDNK